MLRGRVLDYMLDSDCKTADGDFRITQSKVSDTFFDL